MKTLVTAALSLGLAAITLAQVDATKTVVTVNGEAVKGAEYYRRMEYLSEVGKKVGNNLLEAPPGFLTILQLIGEKLMFQLAKERGVMPNDAEVKAEIQQRLADDPDLLKRWAATGQTQAEFEYQIRYEMAKFKLQTAGITITDQEVEKFYKDNPSTFTTPRKYKLWVIAVEDANKANAVDTDLKGGKSFTDVAKARSIDITKAIGGDLGNVELGFLPSAAQKAVEGTKIGSSTGWVDQDGTKVKYYVESVTKEELVPLSPRLKNATRRKLMLDRGRVKNNLAKDLNDMRAKAKVVITQAEFAKLYENILKQNRMVG